ncbi:FAD-dependent pyridine nucleotide-disulfide oxidoreductase [Niveomyces insectorum RCEF 264]|uniref:FAD-dependent pyridine nucleotide-disulfide oxidoreductase n=1 Tax=Niveomyces insectorum RCEF 264 TaxID=1081102 RepID=A0A167WEM0_9HYPO|nr:FAD-dependent pyridine nucleotide-disulfide oxidoreductase [Niveomyces insectorum RCEF 264]
MGDKLRLAALVVTYVAGFVGTALARTLRAYLHRWTYKGPTDHPRTVVVLGGSFAGMQLVRRLGDTLPTGWQAVLVERNSHFNYSFSFPRFAVVPGHERLAFIPYPLMFASAPPGIVRLVQGEVKAVTATEIVLASGETIPYDIAVVATGSAQRPPAKLLGAADRDTACAELRALQDRIGRARTVAVLGGGAVGVELATDIKTFAGVVAGRHKGKTGEGNELLADKEVTLVHSREQLLNRFGSRLHTHTLEVLKKIGIRVVLGQRPSVVYASDAPDAMVGGPGTLRYADGREEVYDCVLLCTGLTPNSALLKDLCPGALNAASGAINVTPSLHVFDDKTKANLPNVFAFGDVAETGGAKMARASFMQAEVVVANVLATIAGRPLTAHYVPDAIEGSIKLTLGKDHSVIYMDQNNSKSILLAKGGEKEDMDVKRAWQFFGAKYTGDEA